MPIDQSKLKEFQEDLEERSQGTSIFFNASKIVDSLDFRVLDPLPNMDGMYALEVFYRWVGKVKIISSEMFGGEDFAQVVIDEAKAAQDPDIDKLLNTKDQFGKSKMRKQSEYWIPGLIFDWDLEGDAILGIYGADDVADVALIEKFIRDGEAKILSSRIQLVKAINREATTRGGSLMFDREKGFNLILGKTGEKRETTYTASKADYLPMPEKYYGAGTPDVVSICKAGIFTDEYIDKIFGEFLYGEALPERTDADYAYPDIRASLKKDQPEEEKKPDRPVRPPRGGTKTTEAPVEAPKETAPATTEAPKEAPARPARGARAATKEDVTKGTRAPRGAKPARNVKDDLKDV